MERKPITRQRSPWEHDHHEYVPDPSGQWSLPVRIDYWRRRANDGTLWAMVNELPIGWHMSISFRDAKQRPSRYPTWDEIMHARDELLPEHVAFVLHLPLPEEYVAVHDSTFHLHEHPERPLPGSRRAA